VFDLRLTDALPEQIVGRGTGIDDVGLGRKREVVTAALARARGAIGTAESAAAGARLLFAHLGGLEIASHGGLLH